MPKKTVLIEWDWPDEVHWLADDNIAMTLHAHCPNTRFTVSSVDGAGEDVVAEPTRKYIDLLYQYVEDLNKQDHVPIDDRVASYLMGFAYWLDRGRGVLEASEP